MQITDVKVRKLFDDGPMKAIASVTFDSQLALHDIKIINAKDKFFIVMPSRKNPDETYRDIVHPINASFRAMLEEKVIKAYEEENAELDRRINMMKHDKDTLEKFAREQYNFAVPGEDVYIVEE